MKKIMVGLAAAAFSLGIHAGTATFTGEGSSWRNPEFVSVTVTVQSECHPSPSAAMAQNNETVVAIQKFLESLLVESPVDKVSTQGGTTRPFSRIISGNHGTEDTELCPRSYQQTTNITFKTSDIANFSRTFAIIQEEILSKYSASTEASLAVTYASIDEPNVGVCAETRELMRLEALAKAHDHARAQFNTLARQCGIAGPVEIASIGERQDSYIAKHASYESAPRSFRSDVVRLSFDAIREYNSVSITYNYPTTVFTVCNEHK